MALYAPYMLRIAIELARHDSAYEEMALTFLDHFINIGAAMDRVVEGDDNMWDEEDGFFYDVLRFPDGSGTRLKVRSLVGLLPLCATSVIDVDALEKLPRFKQRYEAIVRRKSELTENIACPAATGVRDRRLLAVLDDESRADEK